MTRDRIEFVMGEDHGELKKYSKGWLIKSEKSGSKTSSYFDPLVWIIINPGV